MMLRSTFKLSTALGWPEAFCRLLFVTIISGGAMGFTSVAMADDRPLARQMYFPFTPDITTNFVKLDAGRHLGYIRVGIEAVVTSQADVGLVEHHAPLLRDAFIEIIGRAQEGKVRSLTGREELRQECLIKAQALLERETGSTVLQDIIFTTYLYQ